MSTSPATEFGQCMCGEMIGTNTVEIRLTGEGGEPMVLNAVEQGRCPGCASRYYKAETLRVIEEEFYRMRLGPDALALRQGAQPS